jgi:hypothetical protein
LRALEAQTGAGGPVYAIRLLGVDQAEILGTGERVPLAELSQRYPTAQLVRAYSLEQWEAI